MSEEDQKKEDLALHYLKRKIIGDVSDYNNRASNLEKARDKSHFSREIPKLSLREQNIERYEG